MTSAQNEKQMKQTWERSFEEQIARGAYNTAPVEALARTTSYYLRDRCPDGDHSKLHFMEMGCGAGPNLVWIAQKGAKVSAIDISTQALDLCRKNLERNGFNDKIGELVEGSVDKLPFADNRFDGIFESCVFQHLDKETRARTFAEVRRVLKPGGLFAGHMLADRHSIFVGEKDQQKADDPGTLNLQGGGSTVYLTNIGLAHFFAKDEFQEYFKGFETVDPCLTTYYLPASEAKKRGYDEYHQAMWIVHAVK